MATTGKLSGRVQTTISGTITIDLRNLNGLDGNGLRIQRITIINPSTSAGNCTLATGASNGRAIPASIVVPPGGNFSESYNDYGVDIDATNKTLDLTGTNGDTPIVTIELE